MKKLLVAVLTLVMTLSAATFAIAQITHFSANLQGSQEVPPNGSAGVGSGAFELDEGTGMLSWTITFSGLTGTENNAHIHGPAPIGVNAGVQVPLPAGSPKVGSAPLSPAQIADLKAELYYVNIHSTSFGGGEIRGQILQTTDKVPATSVWALSLLAVGLVGATLLVRRRMTA